MRKSRVIRYTSVILTLCMLLTCMSFALTDASAVAAKSVQSTGNAVTNLSTGGDNFTWDNATVYFLLTDRFRNVKTSNDHSYNRGLDKNGNVASISDTRATFHGGDFAGVTQSIEEGYFDDLGVNALWISAPYEQIHGYVIGGDSNPSFAHYSYHGYYVLDYTQTDANFGTAEEFEKLVDTAHEHGIRVIMDIVMNHAGYNSLYDMNQYNFGTVNSGWESIYYNYNNASNSTYHSVIDYDTNASAWANWWGTDWIRCGVVGYKQEGGSDLTNSLAGLPDFRTESSKTVGIPKVLQTKWSKENTLTQKTNEINSYFSKTGKQKTVSNYLSYWLSEWVRKYGVDGFRCDTAKHVEFASWNNLKTTCVSALKEWRQNNPEKAGADWDEDFWMTGECWDHNIGWGYDGYYTQGGFDSMINFETTGAGMLSSGRLAGIYQNYADSINTNDKFNQLSYVSSHDSTLARGDMKYIGSAFLMLPGGVQIFYGDETNRPVEGPFDGNGGAGHSLRSDMNWDSIDQGVLEHWQKVGTFRNNHPSIGAGSNIGLTSTSGVAFGRTYDKNGVTDKAAAVVAASANSSVTIDVSKLWKDGQGLVNAYDQSSAVVQGGKVTFNSGSAGTILIQEPDGRPLMTIKGDAKFKGEQTVTVSLEECDSAVCSIDGGNKFVVKNGDKFVIGPTAYDGDTITITLEGKNEIGSAKSTVTFVKLAEGQSATEPTTQPAPNAKLYVKTWDGSAPSVYAWEGSDTALCGAWPGTKMTEKNSDGYYVIELPTNKKFNVVMNNGNGVQSADVTNLYGDTYLEVTDGSYNTKVISTGKPQHDSTEPGEDKEVIIRVKPYGNQQPYLYVWTDSKEELCGGWPGKQLTDKDEDGNYIYTANAETCNAIVNLGSGQGQTGDITGISGDVTIEVKNEGCTDYKLTKNEKPLSGMALLKSEARQVLAFTASDYTAESWNNLSKVMNTANALIAQGKEADNAAVEAAIIQLQAAKAALVLSRPNLSYAVVGKSRISGIAVQNADVTVVVNGKTYKTTSDEITGEFTVDATSLTSSSAIKVSVTRNDISSADYTYNMSKGNIEGYTPTPTNPISGKLGDVNLNSKIDIEDATLIQKHLVKLVILSSKQLAVSDADGDGVISVKDATEIQKYIVGIPTTLK